MTKELQEKHVDVRVRDRYLAKGTLTDADLKSHLESLPNDESNFELVMIEEDDDLDFCDELSDEEIQNMPAITEDSINNFDFMSPTTEEPASLAGSEDIASNADLGGAEPTAAPSLDQTMETTEVKKEEF